MSEYSGPVLLAFDGSPDSRTALDYAATLLPGAPVTVLSVWEPLVMQAGAALSGMIVDPDVAADHINSSADNPQVVYVQKAIAKAGAASATSAITMSRLKWLQQFRIKQGFQKGKVDLGQLVDPSVRKKALKHVDLPQKCMKDPNIEN